MEEEEDDEDKEKPEHFYRLICLVVDLGTEVLLKLFLKDIPQGQTVKDFLNSRANILNELKDKKVFNDLQLRTINAASPDESCFDISLLYVLISNLTNVQPPNGGWYIGFPMRSDHSAGALLMNLKKVRNEAIAHWPKGKMKKSDFEKYWNDTKDILIELAGEVSQAVKDYVKDEIDRTKVKELVGDQRHKLEALLLWKEQDRNCEKLLSILEDVSKKIDQQGSVLGDKGPIKSSLHALESQMNAKFDQLSIVQEDIKSKLQTNTDQLKTLCQIRQIPGTSPGTESSVPEKNYARPKKRTVLEPFAKKRKFRAIRIKKSHKDKGYSAPDQEDREYVITKNKLRTEIIDHYKVTGCCTTAVPALLDGEEVHIDEMFVMPSMSVRKNMATGTDGITHMRGSSAVTKLTHQETEDVTTGSITTIHELFEKDTKTFRRICVSGDAGQGKTTLCQKIVSTWCKVHSNIENVHGTEHHFLKSFDLLFYLPLRNNKLSDVIEMIKRELVREASHNALKQVREKESENCLIILDGLDEWLPSEDCKHKVPYIDPREKFSVLITSRPWKLEVLRAKSYEIGREVELNGINNDKLIKAVLNLLNKKYAKERYWFEFEFGELRKVQPLAEVPIILTHMVCMWYDDKDFGKTRVEIYSKMLDYIFHVANKRHQEMFDSAWMRPQRSTNTQLVNVFKGFTFCEMYSEIVFKLSDLAYHTLFNTERENSLIFPHSVTEIYNLAENDVKFCLFVGILSQTKCLSKASSHTKSISFVHKSLQEFLAALYIAFEEKDRPLTMMLQTLKCLDDVFEWSEVLKSVSNLRPDLIGDISRYIAQLTDKDERVLQYRHSIRDEDDTCDIVDRIQEIIYDCFVEVPENRILNKTVELHDVYDNLFGRDVDIIPYLKVENIKSLCTPYDEYSDEYSHELEEHIGHDLAKLCEIILSKKHMDLVTNIVERCSSSLTSISVDTYQKTEGILVNMNNFLIALTKASNLTCVKLIGVNLTHSDLEYLGKILSKSTQLREIHLDRIKCTPCQQGQCNYRMDLSHHKQLKYVSLHILNGDIVLGNEVPVGHCPISDGKCVGSILDGLKSSTSLQEFELIMKKCTNKGPEEDNRLHHANSITSSTTIQDNGRDVNPTPLCVSKVLTDVIPTLKNLRKLDLTCIDFNQDILRLSPDMTCLKKVSISFSTMTLQCLQGFIDSLPQTEFIVFIYVSICPQEDTSTALKYITDRYQDSSAFCAEDGRLDFSFCNSLSH